MSSLRGLAPLSLLGAIACADPAPKSDAQPDAAAEQSGDVLRFGAAKIMRAGLEDRAFQLAADGTVTLAGNPYAKLLPDGRMLSPTGEELMRVEADGRVVGSEGPTGITLDETGGALSVPALELAVRFAADGTIEVDASGRNAALLGAGSPQLRSSGCEAAVTKTCALITLSYLSALGNPDSVKQDGVD